MFLSGNNLIHLTGVIAKLKLIRFWPFCGGNGIRQGVSSLIEGKFMPFDGRLHTEEIVDNYIVYRYSTIMRVAGKVVVMA